MNYTNKNHISYQEDVLLIDKFDNIKEHSELLLDNALIFGICLKGKGVVNINNVRYDISPNDMIICVPNVIISSCLVSFDFEGRLFAISLRISNMISSISASDSWDIFQLVNEKPIWPLSKESIKLFMLYYDLFQMHLSNDKDNCYREKKLCSSLQTFSYDLYEIMQTFMQDKKKNEKHGSEYIFREFLNLLSTNYPCNRKVSFYAEKLNITPKHLSFICKQQCGKTVSEVINQHVIKDVQALLRDPRKRIKDICNELDFPNISFFGTYVKKHLNMSPTEYRNKISKITD